jgi:hypothetical protein
MAIDAVMSAALAINLGVDSGELFYFVFGALFAFLQVAACLWTVVAFALWIHRAYVGVATQSEGRMRSPLVAVAAWITPFVNLTLLHSVLLDLWRESRAGPELGARERPAGFGLGWAAWVVGVVLSVVATALSSGVFGVLIASGESPWSLRNGWVRLGAGIDVLASVALGFAAIFATRFVKSVEAAQSARLRSD